MSKQLSLIALLLFGLFAVGCGEVGKCKLYEQGCLGGGVLDGNKCKAGLLARNGYCIDPDSDCGCSGSDLCSADGLSCVNYCGFASNQPEEVPLPPTCRKAQGDQWVIYDFESACRATCMQRCQRAEVFCPGFTCDPNSCQGEAALAACKLEVTTAQAAGSCAGLSDAACITRTCEGVRDGNCNAFECPAGAAKSCNDVRCSNSCGSANNADGFCDDGDPLSASYALCDYGSDCADCGPRRGEQAPVAAIGQPCVLDVGCEGWAADFGQTASWCLHVTGSPQGQLSCVPNCTGWAGKHGACAPGYDCTGLTLASSGEPYVDPRTGEQGYACLPSVCE